MKHHALAFSLQTHSMVYFGIFFIHVLGIIHWLIATHTIKQRCIKSDFDLRDIPNTCAVHYA